MGTTPAQPVEGSAGDGISGRVGAIDPALLKELWRESEASQWLERSDFEKILLDVGAAQNFGLAAGEIARRPQQAAYFSGLKLDDVVLARACASGNERAWEHFVDLYRRPLERAAIAITGSDSLGRDLADQLYAELFGMSTRDGERRCPLNSYRGRGSLIGWLRTTLAQRHVDHYRRSHREQALEEYDTPAQVADPGKPPSELGVLEKAVEEALLSCEAEDRLLLAAYYLDERTMLQIGQVLQVHEATVSRKLKRVCEDLRKQTLKNLVRSGLSQRAADEALGTDPRDLDLNLKKLLQYSQSDAFKDKAAR